MLRAALILLLLINGSAFQAYCQSPDHELPLPKIPGVSMVVKMRYSFMPPPPGSTRFDKDTESVFLIAPDGYAHTRFLCGDGLCIGKETYEYEDGRLARRSYFKSLSRHTLFASPKAHLHRLTTVYEWEYRNGFVSVERQRAGTEKTLTHEIRYVYDNRARVVEERHQYPKQTLIYYPQQDDFVQYSYRHDSVWKYSYKHGRLRDSSVFIQRRNHAGQKLEVSRMSRDGLHFERELQRFDTAGRIIVYEVFSDQPSVRPDGVVLRADRVEYMNDSLGRPDETRFLARGIKRWTFKYWYVR